MHTADFNLTAALMTLKRDSPYEFYALIVSAIVNTNYSALDEIIKVADKNWDIPCRFHRTPLAIAARIGCNEMIKYIISKGSNLNAKNCYGQTPLSEATTAGHLSSVCLLVKGGANVNARDNFGNTALHYAVAYMPAVATILLEKDAVIDSLNSKGFTPLHNAVDCGNNDCVSLLVKGGANVNAKTHYDDTPLILAAKSNNSMAIKILLENGANIGDMNNNFKNAVAVAQDSGASAALAMLKKPNRPLPSVARIRDVLNL